MEKTMSRFDSALKEAKEALRFSESMARMPLKIEELRNALSVLVREAEDAIVLARSAGYDEGYEDGMSEGYHKRALEHPS